MMRRSGPSQADFLLLPAQVTILVVCFDGHALAKQHVTRYIRAIIIDID
jgi:hypothetical protein